MAPVQSDDVDDVVNQYPLLELSKATAIVEPSAAHDLLFSIAVKSNHYWASAEYLGTYLAEHDLAGTLTAAENSYQTDFGGSSQYALRAALFVLARKDLNKAMQGIWRMRDPDDEIAALTLAQQLLAAGKKTEAERVVAEVEKTRSNSRLEWTGRTLKELRRQLATEAPATTTSTTITPAMIDDFIKNPDANTLERFSTGHQVVFRDKVQATQFVTVALPLKPNLPSAVCPLKNLLVIFSDRVMVRCGLSVPLDDPGSRRVVEKFWPRLCGILWPCIYASAGVA